MVGDEKHEHIEQIRREIEASRGTRVWSGYVKALNLISDVVFTRATGFIFELIQNAEDAGFGLGRPVNLSIDISNNRIRVVHDAAPFTRHDVDCLCGIGSSKKPEQGTLGYLGIGFKSVLMVTDAPEVYSGGYRFKFDRNAWSDPDDTPWHVLPLWIPAPSEQVDPDKTTFILPLRHDDGEAGAVSLKANLVKLQESLFLFLKHMTKITASVQGEKKPFLTLENAGVKDGISKLSKNGIERQFLLKRKVVDVTSDVAADRLTRKYRRDVTKREIVLGFALDKDSNLAPTEAGAMHGGVYSFQPVGESKSGAKFPIQADFLVQPGRDALNHEAKWNRWLVDELAALCREAVTEFTQHPKWKYQFLPVFDFAHNKGLEAYENLFRDHLIEPMEDHIRTSSIIPTADGTTARLCDIVRMDEPDDASRGLVDMGLFSAAELPSALGGQQGLQFAHPEVVDSESYLVRKVSRDDLLKNDALLPQKGVAVDSSRWFRLLYLWLNRHPKYYEYESRKRVTRGLVGYHERRIVLTADGMVRRGGSEGNDGGVRFLDVEPSDVFGLRLARKLAATKPMLHPDLLSEASAQEASEVKGFLAGYAGVREIKAVDVCREMLLPRIIASATTPTAEDLVMNSQYCQYILGPDLGGNCELWVLDKEGKVRRAMEIYLSSIYEPSFDWEAHSEFLSGHYYVSPNYLPPNPTAEDLGRWRRFFGAGGVKGKPDGGVEDFAVNYAMERLKPYKCADRVERQKFGDDLRVTRLDGSEMCVEVKGQTVDSDVELKANEADAAEKKKQYFYLFVVHGIPNSPTGRLLRNPWDRTDVEKDSVLRIPISTWKLGEQL